MFEDSLKESSFGIDLFLLGNPNGQYFSLKSINLVSSYTLRRSALIFRFCRNKLERPKLRWKLYAIAVFILLMALVEHILSIVVNSAKYDWNSERNSTFQNFLQAYCTDSHAFILEIGK